MLRISAFITVLMLLGTTGTGALAAQDRSEKFLPILLQWKMRLGM